MKVNPLIKLVYRSVRSIFADWIQGRALYVPQKDVSAAVKVLKKTLDLSIPDEVAVEFYRSVEADVQQRLMYMLDKEMGYAK
jgi:hypothetical protein